MTESNHENPHRYSLDDELDTALANFAAVEPREGLESRILANLQSAGVEKTRPTWWNWSAAARAAALITAVAIVVIAGMVWRFETVNRGPVARQPVKQVQPQQQASSNRGLEAPHPGREIRHKATHRDSGVHARVGEDHPRLEQFPSPQPLSEQERILANYVAEYPTHAAGIAQARAEALLQDRNEELAASGTLATR